MENQGLQDLPRMVDSVFSRNGILSTIEGKRYNLSQQRYANALAEILAQGRSPDTGTRISMLEAETGTGKTLAYLVNLILYSAITGDRVGISTYTLDLQTQIWGDRALREQRVPNFDMDPESDLALARHLCEKVWEKDGVFPAFSGFTFRRGSGNFLSVTRARRLIARLDEKIREREDWKVFAEQVEEVAKGSASASFGLLMYIQMPIGVTANDICIERPTDKHENPLYRQMLDLSRAAQVVITTHHTMVIHAKRWNGLLEYDYDDGGSEGSLAVLLYDEADQVESAAEMMSRVRVRPVDFIARIKQALTDMKLDKVKVSAIKDGDPLESMKPLLLSANAAMESTVAVDRELMDLWDAVQPHRSGEQVMEISLTSRDHANIGRECLKMVNDWNLAMQEMEKLLPLSIRNSWRYAMEDLTALGMSLETLFGEKDAPMHGRFLSQVPGISWTPQKNLAGFDLLDIYPARVIGRHWAYGVNRETGEKFDAHVDQVIFTSATLSSWGIDPWNGMKSVFGIQETEIVDGERKGRHTVHVNRVSAHSGFGGIDRIFTASPNAPHPTVGTVDEETGLQTFETNPQWVVYAADTLAHLLLMYPGEPGLALSLSYKDVRLLAEQFGKRYPHLTDRVFWHDRSGMDQQGVPFFTAGVAALRNGSKQLMVTPSAWEGKDIRQENKGQLLRHLVILRVPFPPADGLRQKALQAYLEFTGHAEKNAEGILMGLRNRQAFFRLRQGLGRLIRSGTDRGTFWITDYRVAPPALLLAGTRWENEIRRTNGPDFWTAIPQRFREDMEDRLTIIAPKYRGQNIVDGSTLEEVLLPMMI